MSYFQDLLLKHGEVRRPYEFRGLCIEAAAEVDRLRARVGELEGAALGHHQRGEQLEARLAEAERDSKRLDWLDNTNRGLFFNLADDPEGNPTRKIWCCDEAGIECARPFVREAIDAAMKGADVV